MELSQENNKDINKFIRIFKRQFKFKDFDSQNTSFCRFQPFHKGRVKIKKRGRSFRIEN